jgi:ABC-type uncharacterized transport system permease subunit
MKLVADAHEAWKWLSTWFFALIAAAPIVWAELPQDAKEMIPEALAPYIITLLALAGFVGRLKDQS